MELECQKILLSSKIEILNYTQSKKKDFGFFHCDLI